MRSLPNSVDSCENVQRRGHYTLVRETAGHLCAEQLGRANSGLRARLILGHVRRCRSPGSLDKEIMRSTIVVVVALGLLLAAAVHRMNQARVSMLILRPEDHGTARDSNVTLAITNRSTATIKLDNYFEIEQLFQKPCTRSAERVVLPPNQGVHVALARPETPGRWRVRASYCLLWREQLARITDAWRKYRLPYIGPRYHSTCSDWVDE